ncbi:hypothetical protein CCYA_CCYA11G3149 [Cyanidiococcus yangmingshanensis]|nr:hypothetical protein CCYA_CCYA11G3149 [Cyanidiococcus yangmingshanensis]
MQPVTDSSQTAESIDAVDAEITATLRVIEMNFLGALEQVDRIQSVAKRYVQWARKLQAFAAPWQQRFVAVAQERCALVLGEEDAVGRCGSDRRPVQEINGRMAGSMTDAAARIRALLPNRPRTIDWGNLSALLEDDSLLYGSRENWLGVVSSLDDSGLSLPMTPRLERSARCQRLAPFPDESSSSSENAEVSLDKAGVLGARDRCSTDAPLEYARERAEAIASHSEHALSLARQLAANTDLSLGADSSIDSTPDGNEMANAYALDVERFPEKFRDGHGALQLQQLYNLFCRHPGRAFTSSQLVRRLDESFNRESVELLCELLASRHYLVAVSSSATLVSWTLAEEHCDRTSTRPLDNVRLVASASQTADDG